MTGSTAVRTLTACGTGYWRARTTSQRAASFKANDPKCKRFDPPAGYDALETNKYNVSLDELMQG